MHLTNDKMIWIPSDDDWHAWGANYEKIEFENIMNHHISNWDVALDVGAHVGIWSMRLAEKFKRVSFKYPTNITSFVTITSSIKLDTIVITCKSIQLSCSFY